MNAEFHLAQINIAKGIATLDNPLMRGFVDQLDHLNSLAESSQGFIWRLQDESGDATNINAFGDDRIIINMSVWDSLESLQRYVYSGDHLETLKEKKSWFQKMDTPHLALWWIPADSLPTIDDGKRALASLHEHGPTASAFTFASPQPHPE